MQFILYIFLAFAFTSVQSQYTATVVEHNPHREESAEATLLKNAEIYVQRITEAKGNSSSIVVFPEYGLTGILSSSDDLDTYSTLVPDSDSDIPCANSTYSKFLVDISCKAQENSIYVVINLIEKSSNASNSSIYYNTNVVFNDGGAVVARYRKINLLSSETRLTAGNEATTFSTPFGVFGLFTGIDIAYKNPAIEILTNSSVTSIAYPTYWTTEVPFGSGLSVQAGYSRANRVNLLAASLSQSGLSSSGSGIYQYDGAIVNSAVYAVSTEVAVSGSVLVAEGQTRYVCDNNIAPRSGIGGIIGGVVPDASAFPAAVENLQNYTVRDLDLNSNNITETICSTSSFCCTIDVVISSKPDPLTYSYKLVAFHGTREFGNGTIGVRICGLVSCNNNDTSSCGTAIATDSFITFERISVQGTFTNNSNTNDQPVTLLNSMQPLSSSDYSLCIDGLSGSTSVNVSVATTNSISVGLRSFGIYGRVFSLDNTEVGVRSGSIGKHYFTSLALFIFVFAVKLL